MFVCLRVDLDYVPWDSPDAHDFGHGEPAMTLKLLDLGRQLGVRYHFFASERVLRAFPTASDAILNDGHHLDWLSKHPDKFDERYAVALERFQDLGIEPQGFAVRDAWPKELEGRSVPEKLKFMSSPPGACPSGIRLFPVETRPEREVIRTGQTFRVWSDGVRVKLREAASIQKGITVIVRPQVLYKADPKLVAFRETVEFALSLGMSQRTLREVMSNR